MALAGPKKVEQAEGKDERVSDRVGVPILDHIGKIHAIRLDVPCMVYRVYRTGHGTDDRQQLLSLDTSS